jgi:hypothetical protein
MRRFARHLFKLLAAVSLLMGVAVCVLWVRARTVADSVEWTYDRYLADRSAASDQVFITSNRRRIWVDLCHGQVGPYNGQLVYGYYVNADNSGGRPLFKIRSRRYDQMEAFGFGPVDPDSGKSGWGPIRWQTTSRSRPKNGDDFRYIGFGVSHGLVALLCFIAPTICLIRFRRARRARNLGLCVNCHYDLRATPPGARCPECGTVTPIGAATGATIGTPTDPRAATTADGVASAR